MKKFLEEFKEFALKGNVMSLAIGVIIGERSSHWLHLLQTVSSHQ